MKKRHDSYIIFSFLLLFFILYPCSASAEKPACYLADFAPGKPDTVFKALGMPFPDDTAGVHFFCRKGSPGELWFYIRSDMGRRRIEWVMLTRRDLVSRQLKDNSHCMLSPADPVLIYGPGNIRLGDPMSKVLKNLGPPLTKGRDGIMEVYEYSYKNFLLKIGTVKNRVQRIYLSE